MENLAIIDVMSLPQFAKRASQKTLRLLGQALESQQPRRVKLHEALKRKTISRPIASLHE